MGGRLKTEGTYVGLRLIHVGVWQKATQYSKAKNLPASARDAKDAGSVSGLGRSPAVGKGNPFQYSCLENFMDKGALWATVHGVPQSQIRLHTAHRIIFTICNIYMDN